MHRSRRVRVFTDKYPLVGPVLWIATVEYFVLQLVVVLRFRGYSLRFNTISDLGNTTCGLYDGRNVCSPLFMVMNAAFIALGVLMVAGAWLIYQEFRESAWSLVGFSAMGIAGVGTVVVGVFPENTISILHVVGASLPFVVGNISLIILGSALKLPGWLRATGVLLGVIALVALYCFVSKHYGPFGRGGVERITAYPQTIWLILFGLYMSKSRWKRQRTYKKGMKKAA